MNENEMKIKRNFFDGKRKKIDQTSFKSRRLTNSTRCLFKGEEINEM